MTEERGFGAPATSPSGEAWRRIRSHFDVAVDLPRPAVEAYVRELEQREPGVAGEVASLVFAHQAAEATPSFLGRPVARVIRSRAGREVPSEVGAYRLLQEIGRGGMAKVYLAERADDTYHKRVAIKVLRRGLETADLKARFHRERRILAGLDHPGIARLLDGGTTPDGRPYLVMDHVEGEALDVHCRRAGLGARARLELLARVCEAVHFAHQNGIVHGDLKTTNLVVTPAGDPKLLDFGVARVLGPQPAALGSESDSAWTPVTLDSASPEQLQGEPATTASDVFSLGLLALELLAARTGDDASTSAPSGPPSTGPASLRAAACGAFRGQAAEDLASVLAKALAHRPDERYATAGDLAADLGHLLAARPVGCVPPTPLRFARRAAARHRALAAIAAATTAALVLFGCVSLFQGLADRRRVALAQRFFEEGQRIESLARIARLLPANEAFPLEARIRERLAAIAAAAAALGAEAEVPAAYPLAVGRAALGDLEGAQRLLDMAWARGYRTPAVAVARGRTLVARYVQDILAAERLSDAAPRRAARRRAEIASRDPALALLVDGRVHDPAIATFLEAAIAFADGRLAEAEVKARAAFAERPWLYEAKRLEGEVYLRHAQLHDTASRRDEALFWSEKADTALGEALGIGRSDADLRAAICAWRGTLTAMKSPEPISCGDPFPDPPQDRIPPRVGTPRADPP